MKIEPARFRKLVETIYETEFRDNALLTPEVAKAIVGIGRLAIDSDRREDPDELATYESLARQVCALAGIGSDEVVNEEAKEWRGDDDRAARMKVRAAQLVTRRARELAYSVAYIITIADLDIARSESEFLDSLLVEFDIDDERAEVLYEQINDAIAPE
jgi:hypothetical protein